MWSAVTKASIAEAVLALTKLLDEERRGSVDFLHSPSLWLTLAALCLLQDEHVERLSSTQWARGAVNKVQSNIISLSLSLSLHDYVDLTGVACSFFHSAKHKSSLDFDDCKFAAPSNVFYIQIRFSLFSFSSRNAQITTTVKQGHRLCVPSVARFASIATECFTCHESFAVISAKCAKRKRRPLKLTCMRDAVVSNSFGFWHCRTRVISNHWSNFVTEPRQVQSDQHPRPTLLSPQVLLGSYRLMVVLVALLHT